MSSNTKTLKTLVGNKLAVGGIVIAISSIVGSAGIAAAAPASGHAPSMPANVAACKKLSPEKVGPCVAAFARHHGGHGYGGNGNGNHINTNVNVHVNGNNNVVKVVVNYIFNFFS
jgi:hypothetical protein